MAVTTAAVIGATAAAGGLALSAKSMSDQKKAAAQAAEAAKNSGVNVPQVNQLAEEQAIRNARNSAALEKELNPLAPELRTKSLQAVIDSLGNGTYDDAIQQRLFQDFNGQDITPQYEDYGQSELSQAAQARALQELQLGGKLDTETANQVIRSSAAKAGGFGNTLGLGRDLSARDLGLTSLQLARQRLATAGGFGQAQDAFTAQRMGAKNSFGLSAAQLALAQQQQRADLGFGLNAMGQQGFNRSLQAAQLGQSIAPPVTGLDPGSIANLAVGNSNLQANAAQNAAGMRASAAGGLGQLGGSLTGVGLGVLGNASAYQQRQQTPVLNYNTVGTATRGIYSPPLGGNASSAAAVRGGY